MQKYRQKIQKDRKTEKTYAKKVAEIWDTWDGGRVTECFLGGILLQRQVATELIEIWKLIDVR